MEVRSSDGNISRILIQTAYGAPIHDAQILLVAKDNTHKVIQTDLSGIVDLKVLPDEECSIFIAHKNYLGKVVYTFKRGQILPIKLFAAEGIGSIIFPNGSGFLPILEGTLRFKLDSMNGLLLFADNVAINNSAQQPVHFKLNVPIKLEDQHANAAYIKFLEIRGDSSIIEYSRKMMKSSERSAGLERGRGGLINVHNEDIAPDIMFEPYRWRLSDGVSRLFEHALSYIFGPVILIFYFLLQLFKDLAASAYQSGLKIIGMMLVAMLIFWLLSVTGLKLPKDLPELLKSAMQAG